MYSRKNKIHQAVRFQDWCSQKVWFGTWTNSSYFSLLCVTNATDKWKESLMWISPWI